MSPLSNAADEFHLNGSLGLRSLLCRTENGACPKLPGHDGDVDQYLKMVCVYDSHGGLFAREYLAPGLAERIQGPDIPGPRPKRSMVSFPWRGMTMVPLFQFEIATVTLRQDVAQVTRELSDVVDDWDMAVWYARPNGLLHGLTPVDALRAAKSEVLHAARAYRFLLS